MIHLNKIYNEDCLITLGNLDTSSIDMVLTSPPYGELRDYNGYVFNFEETAKGLWKVIRPGGVVIWVVGDQTKKGTESGESFRQALYFKELGFRLHDTMLYHKLNYVPLTHKRYEQCFEYMFCFSKGKPNTFNPIKITCKNAGKKEKYGQERRQNFGKNHSMRLYEETKHIETKETKIAPNLFSYTLGKEKTGHPASFPEQLAKDQIQTWSNVGDIVLDPFIGSGTVAKVCIELGRNWIGSEISPEYCESANKRISGTQALFQF